jgi:hypothetical protein
VHHL